MRRSKPSATTPRNKRSFRVLGRKKGSGTETSNPRQSKESRNAVESDLLPPGTSIHFFLIRISTLVLMSLADAQKFFELEGAVTNIEIRHQRRQSIPGGSRSDSTAFRLSLLCRGLDAALAQPFFRPQARKDGLFFRAFADGFDRRI